MSHVPRPTTVVVGAINVDERLRVARLPRPGETAVGAAFERGLGGKGANQAAAASRAGSRTRLVGAVGGDTAGRWAREVLVEAGTDVTAVLVHEQEQTGRAVIAVDDAAENLILVGLGVGASVTPRDVVAALGDLEDGDVLVLQLELPVEVALAAASTARARGARVVLNAAPAPTPGDARVADLLRTVDVLVVNGPEAAALVDASPDEDGTAAVETLAARTGLPVVGTVGAAGAVVAQDGRSTRIAAPRVTAVDTTGAGDTFTGYLAAGIAAGLDLTEATGRAVRAASIAVTRPGTLQSIPSAHELDAPDNPDRPVRTDPLQRSI